ncbi:ATP-binding protein [Streptomyces sp. NPDC015346]|uniref:ATP-binding protein n=1 Tax=Streptomyces sp. NPDC015346 TaxID=3364954 RepID=UPI0036FF4BA2
MIDWSWGLLTDDERMVLRRLAVFTDGCTLAAAERVCGDGDRNGRGGGGGRDQIDVLGPLIRLVDRSLVTVADGPRYRLPESIAAYALERLAEAGESDVLNRRHQAYYTELAEQAAPHLYGSEQQRRLTLLDQERGNLRGALERAVRGKDVTGALRLALASTWYWFLRGRLSEARRSLEGALRLSGHAEPALRSDALLWHAGFTVLAAQGSGRTVRTPDVTATDETAADATAAGETATEKAGSARGVWFLGYALLSAGENLSRSEALVDRALNRLRTAGDRWGTAAALSTRAAQALLRGDLAAVRHSAGEGHALFEELGDHWGQLQTSYPLAALAGITGDYARAAQLHREGLRLAEDLGFWTHAADRLTGLGRVALLTGDVPEATELHRKAMALAAEHGYAAGEIHAEIGLALAARREGDLDLAEQHLRTALAWHRRFDFDPGPALLLAELGFLAEQRGQAADALSLHRQSLAVAREGGDPRAVALAYEGLAGAYVLLGEPERAARLLGTAARAREAAGAPLPKAERGDVDRITARVLAALGMPPFTAAFSADIDESDGGSA